MNDEEILEIIRNLPPEEKVKLLQFLQRLTQGDIERRCRYRLAKHGMRFHKKAGAYLVYQVDDPDETKEYTLNQLTDYCERLSEKEK